MREYVYGFGPGITKRAFELTDAELAWALDHAERRAFTVPPSPDMIEPATERLRIERTARKLGLSTGPRES